MRPPVSCIVCHACQYSRLRNYSSYRPNEVWQTDGRTDGWNDGLTQWNSSTPNFPNWDHKWTSPVHAILLACIGTVYTVVTAFQSLLLTVSAQLYSRFTKVALHVISGSCHAERTYWKIGGRKTRVRQTFFWYDTDLLEFDCVDFNYAIHQGKTKNITLNSISYQKKDECDHVWQSFFSYHNS